jgi:excisionase family DNA binding protein
VSRASHAPRSAIPGNHAALGPEFVEAIADAVARRLADQAIGSSPWLTADQAADYIGAKLSRVRKLTAIGALPHYKDGPRRVLYRREELDDFIRSGGSSTE